MTLHIKKEPLFKQNKDFSLYEENKKENLKELIIRIKEKEEVVVALLENISEKINSGQSPLENSGAGIKDKIREKKDMIEKSVNTLEEAKAKYE